MTKEKITYQCNECKYLWNWKDSLCGRCGSEDYEVVGAKIEFGHGLDPMWIARKWGTAFLKLSDKDASDKDVIDGSDIANDIQEYADGFARKQTEEYREGLLEEIARQLETHYRTGKDDESQSWEKQGILNMIDRSIDFFEYGKPEDNDQG